ncbi:MAG TPA: YceI family protein [Candidatus Acidoferrum sp.]|nr:YceI family protein [Candidatus Acidoferrum sp.]
MQVSSWRSALGTACGILGIAVFLSATAAPPRPQATQVSAQEVTLEVDPSQSKVHFVVESTLHTVHGTFALKKGSLVHFDPESGKAGGEIAVYATSGESGNSSRDERMHKEILETAKYPDAIFRPKQIEGKASRDGASDVKLHGVMLLHGSEHEVVALVHAEVAGDHWKGTAKFEVPYIQWGIKDPSNWLLKVKPVVNVELDMAGLATSVK